VWTIILPGTTMASLDDAKRLQERVYELSRGGNLDELRALLDEHVGVDVDGCKDANGMRALTWSCIRGYTECAQLLIDHNADVNAKFLGVSALDEAASVGQLSCVKLLVKHGADVNCQTKVGLTPLMTCASRGYLRTAHFLLEQKADVRCRALEAFFLSRNEDALYFAMRQFSTNRTPGIAFAMLSCNTDAKNVLIDRRNTLAMRNEHIEEYKRVQAFIDEYREILHLVLSDHVQVDTRVGRGDNGIYQEPIMECTLEYLGLSMNEDQVVNASIDGEREEGIKRALIPGHLLNANHWFNKYKSPPSISS
jgi:hypothetical protein